MRGKMVFLAILVFTCLIIFNPTCSYYISNKNVSVTATGSNIICDAEIVEVPSNEKSMYGYSEFKVVVKNHDDYDNVTGVNYDYTLTIENDNSSNGLFGYNNDNFQSSLVLNGSMNTSYTENNYIIQVKSTSGSSEAVNYNVSLSCTQSN